MKKSKYDRILSIYSMLNRGELIKKHEISTEFGVTGRTIQRDIDDIRAFYYDNTLNIGYGKTIVFDRKRQGYRLTEAEKDMLTNSEILAVCKILLESRSMRSDEIMPIIEKLLNCCIPESNKKAVKKLISNEQFHYVQPRHNNKIIDFPYSEIKISDNYLLYYPTCDLLCKHEDLYSIFAFDFTTQTSKKVAINCYSCIDKGVFKSKWEKNESSFDVFGNWLYYKMDHIVSSMDNRDRCDTHIHRVNINLPLQAVDLGKK